MRREEAKAAAELTRRLGGTKEPVRLDPDRQIWGFIQPDGQFARWLHRPPTEAEFRECRKMAGAGTTTRTRGRGRSIQEAELDAIDAEIRHLKTMREISDRLRRAGFNLSTAGGQVSIERRR